ncbi:L,D-transpeptidase [Parasedimentitalea maritima]|uniref:L,D-transpeptidase n=1 Tax=Parasedimentitalea maritima TaxID=2578117 RepID=A0A5R8Z0U7_9RHOB|nr:L,D-transpeptidase [Zongyanglinia marina]KAE9628291.1 L,D-transpeptidase family protein [Zongyanglinia marina]TLP59310.1 L,D-transpeptidase [Zongyanglinia marina]
MSTNCFSRRHFINSAAASSLALSLPSLALAKSKPAVFDPTPQEVRIKKEFEPGQLLILPRSFYLYFVTDKRKALRYGVGVGRAGLEFTGSAIIEVKKEWPTWRPTDEMIEREPRTYSRFVDNKYVQPGGPTNPLGARALYLFQNGVDTYFRIHGTTQPETIGQSVSNGCIRMLNEHVIDLYQRVPVGTVVTVL